MKKFKKISVVFALILVAILIVSALIPKSLFCKHDTYVDGVCERCEKQCLHLFESNEKCSICDVDCEHDYNNGMCDTCNNKCIHTWENGKCTNCDVYCDHVSYTNGQCDVCKYSCIHDHYENSVCSTCQYECMHEMHSLEKGICLKCETYVFHNYVNGKCIICDRVPTFYNDFLPDEYYVEHEKKGNVETISYTCENCFAKDSYIDRQMTIWTPYGYNENTKYNVLVLMHGGGGSHEDWVSSTFKFAGRSVKLSNIYDQIVEENNVAPFIVVSIPANFSDNQIAHELRTAILPYVVENYSTWAEGSDAKDIMKVRDHFGIGGLSNGSLHTFNAGMSMCFDLFGNYMGISGNGQQGNVEKTITSEDYDELSVRCFFSGCGTNDGLRYQTFAGYNHILECSNERFVEGVNSWYQDVIGGHEWKVWTTEIVNALQVMF